MTVTLQLPAVRPEAAAVAGLGELPAREHAHVAGAVAGVPARAIRTDVGVDLLCDAGTFVELDDTNESQLHQIKSDIPLQIRESSHWRFFGGTHRILTGTGRTGSGANRVKITTMGGNITIRRR